MFVQQFVQTNIKEIWKSAFFKGIPLIVTPKSSKANLNSLTHWGRVTHICVCNLIIIGSDNGLSPDWRQAIIWTNAGIFLIGPLGTNFSEVLVEIITFSFKKMYLKVSSAKMVSILSRPQCVNSFPPRQNGLHFVDDIFKCIFVNEKFCVLIKISLKFVPKGPIDNNQPLV